MRCHGVWTLNNYLYLYLFNIDVWLLLLRVIYKFTITENTYKMTHAVWFFPYYPFIYLQSNASFFKVDIPIKWICTFCNVLEEVRNYLNETLIDNRQLHSQVNMLQKSLIRAKITVSIDPTRDTSIPVYVHHTNEIYSWEQKRAKYYCNHLIQEIVTSTTSKLYWRNFTNIRITEDLLSKSYMSKIKLIRNKKLAETNFKILNNILPSNKNLHKWGKSETKLCYICGEEESISHLLYHL